MLRLIIEGDEFWDEVQNLFSTINDEVIELEHSLFSVSKWESIYQKPFLASGDRTNEEVLGYIKAMILTPNVDPDVLNKLGKTHIDAIQEYIDSSQSATTFGMMPERQGSGEVITSELIYYWLVAFNIPFECQYWHLNRLFSLIRICNIKNSKPKKMSRNEMAQRYRDINAERKARLGTKG
jgi:hypothetical protein